jgi:hypothetical protein
MEHEIFTSSLTTRLVDLYRERQQRIECLHDKPGLASDRRKAWDEITTILNSEGGKFSASQVKKRWQNLKMKTKQAHVALKRERQKTGGGEQPKELSEIQQAVIDVAGSSKAFHGEDKYVETPIGIQKEEANVQDHEIERAPKRRKDNQSSTPSQLSSTEMRALQKEALESQIEANKGQILACDAIINLCEKLADHFGV